MCPVQTFFSFSATSSATSFNFSQHLFEIETCKCSNVNWTALRVAGSRVPGLSLGAQAWRVERNPRRGPAGGRRPPFPLVRPDHSSYALSPPASALHSSRLEWDPSLSLRPRRRRRSRPSRASRPALPQPHRQLRLALSRARPLTTATPTWLLPRRPSVRWWQRPAALRSRSRGWLPRIVTARARAGASRAPPKRTTTTSRFKPAPRKRCASSTLQLDVL